ncbi:hypothetical protein [uncultured Jannaschia sp.]|uniref:hypothetical protein n=1 Tax=uncultured Jannaschia sp. TaxID=293347 RepID=UPI00263629A8|nr:hypothetical protein [uncultured Jannaschia sp.]
MPSSHYRELKKNAQSLRKHLLPAKFNPMGDYRERVFTGVVAFRILCHAAIEEYFEVRAIEIAKSALSQCRTTGKVSLPAIALMGFSGREHGLPPHTIDPPEPSKKKAWPSEIEIKQRLNDCTSSFVQRISRDNHGVRERNILSMLIPIGIDPVDIDRLFLSEIDNFGMSRGDYAHKAPSIHTAKRPDPKDELSKIQNY